MQKANFYKYCNIFVLPFLLFVLTIFFVGSYYETYDDATYELFFRGFFSPDRLSGDLSYVHIFTGTLFSFLYKNFPNVAWYGLILHSFLFCGLVNIFLLLYNKLSMFVRPYGIPILFALVYFLFFWNNVYLFNFTRPAILMMGTALLVAFSCVADRGGIISRKGIWAILCFVLGMLTRPDITKLCFIIVIPAVGILYYKKGNVKKLLVVLATFIFIFLALFLYRKINENDVIKKFYHKTVLISNFIDYGFRKDVHLDRNDHLKEETLRNWLFADDEALSNDFLQTLTYQSVYDQKPGLEKVKYFIYDIGHGLWNDKIHFLIINIAFLLFALMAVTTRGSNIIPFLSIVFYQVFFWCVVFWVCLFYKMPDRLLDPLLILYTLSAFLMISKLEWDGVIQNKMLKIISTCVLVMLFLFTNSFANQLAGLKQFYKRQQKNAMVLNEINHQLKGKVIVLDFLAQNIIVSNNAMRGIPLSVDIRLLSIIDAMSMLPPTKRQMKKYFNSDRFIDLFDYASSSNDIVFISHTSTNDLLSNYCHSLYHKGYIFEQVSKENQLTRAYHLLNYYQVKKADPLTPALMASQKTAIVADIFTAKGQTEIGKYMRATGKKEEAIDHLQRAIFMNPNAIEALYHLGLIYEDSKEYKTAVKYFNKAIISSSSGYEEAFNDIGICYYKLNQFEESIKAFKSLIELNPSHSKAYYNLGRIYLDRGKMDQAEMHFKKALMYDSDYTKAKEALIFLSVNRVKLKK